MMKSRWLLRGIVAVADFRWLVGRWVGTGLGGVSEEVWTEPAVSAASVPPGGEILRNLFFRRHANQGIIGEG